MNCYKCLLGPVIVVAMALGGLTGTAKATVLGINIDITAVSASPNFGTGVAVGDVFAGEMFYDDADPNYTANGTWQRIIIPGGDTLVIAGIDFSSILSDPIWPLTFVSGDPVYLGDLVFNGCGDVDAAGVGDATNNLLLRDNLSGQATAPGPASSRAHFLLNYVLTNPRSVPEPATGLIILAGLAGILLLRRRKIRHAQT